MAVARADLESLLRHRKLDVTLSSCDRLPVPGEETVLPTGIGELDARLGGGIPRGQLSEIAGPASSGRTSLLAALLASTTTRGELAALVDPFDRFDPPRAAAAGVDLQGLLWIRSDVDRALKALNLVLQCGRFGLAALDLSDVPMASARRIPFTTWMRLHRVIEGSRTACVLIAPEPMARSSAGLTMATRCDARSGIWSGTADRARLFRGLVLDVRVVRSRFRAAEEGRTELRATW
jgi:hypothetical protein